MRSCLFIGLRVRVTGGTCIAPRYRGTIHIKPGRLFVDPTTHGERALSLTIGDTAPDFSAETTLGPIDFHEWIGDGWAVLFSHPRAFTPVCTTELGYMARIKPEFDKRGAKIIAISTDPADDSRGWSDDIETLQGTAVNYPIIADTDHAVAKAYGMLPADV